MQMQDKISFGNWEAAMLLTNLICAKIFLYYTRMTAEDAGTAAWILSVYISLLALIMFMVLIKLFRKFEGRDILDIAEIAGGKPLKIITGLVLTGVLLYLSVAFLREFTEEMKVVSLPTSPLSYIMFFFIIGVVVGSYLGIEAILRYNAIIVPVITVGFIAILIGVIPQIDLTNLFPLLGNGPYSIFGKGFFRVSVFAELVILFLMPPFLGNYKNVKRVGYIAIGLSSAFFIAGSMMYILTFPYPSNLESFLPIYQMARLINLGRFFQRIEAVFVFIWAMAAFIYLAATFYFMVYAIAKTSGLKYMRPLIFPFAVIVYSAAFIPQNLITVINFKTHFFNKTAWLVTFVFTGLIMAIANLRKDVKRR